MINVVSTMPRPKASAKAPLWQVLIQIVPVLCTHERDRGQYSDNHDDSPIHSGWFLAENWVVPAFFFSRPNPKLAP